MACGLLLWQHLGFQLFQLHHKHGSLTLGYCEVDRQRFFTPVMWNIQWLYLTGSLAICYVNHMVDKIPSFYLTDN
jgi:hypothetical protein